jgi:AraC family transcriptional regulator of adaptative response / DNA-3-methyladenine glycosylase II
MKRDSRRDDPILRAEIWRFPAIHIPPGGQVLFPLGNRTPLCDVAVVDAYSDRFWRAILACDSRFDGWVFCAVTSTGIYCRPSCPARTPKRENVRFFLTAAAAQAAGFRACKRCRPDATPGSPEWDLRADVVGRAMRLIADGVVDRDGVGGLAARLGYTKRHIHRQLVAVVGAEPLALARAQRAQTARILLETTSLPVTQVCFAAGFQSVRQFNATVQEVFASTPTALRARARMHGQPEDSGVLSLRLPYRVPFDGLGTITFLARRVVPGVEEVIDGAYRRSLRLPHGLGAVELRPADGYVQARFRLDDLRDLAAAIERSRALLDLDSDPQSVSDALRRDRVLGRLVRETPGRRVVGTVDGAELAVRAVLGQQVALRAASTLAGRLVARHGEELQRPFGAVTHTFPTAAALADASGQAAAGPTSRQRALTTLVSALASGELVIDAGADRVEARRGLVALPGVGSWTADYVAMRAMRDPDVFIPGDLGVRKELEALGRDATPAAALRLAERWRPYRSYAVQHLWASLERRKREETTRCSNGVRRRVA